MMILILDIAIKDFTIEKKTKEEKIKEDLWASKTLSNFDEVDQYELPFDEPKQTQTKIYVESVIENVSDKSLENDTDSIKVQKNSSDKQNIYFR